MACCAPNVDTDAEVIGAPKAEYTGDKHMQFLGDSEKTEALQQRMKEAEGGDMRAGVALPDGEDVDLWIANYTLYFFNRTSAVWETFKPFVTKENSPVMCAGADYEYLWMEGGTVTRPIRVSAPEYIAKDLEWTDKELDDQTLFPQTSDGSFTHMLQRVAATIFKRLFRIYAHLFTMHHDKVTDDAELALKHLIFFIREYKVVEPKELAPLKDKIDELVS